MTEPNKIPLNQILYGPPGTGKTYNTINKALEILGEKKTKDRSELKNKFNEYKDKGQIEFITFHQNYSYEEFIEGIAPVLENDEASSDQDQGEVKYKIKDGIFKELCKKALEQDSLNNFNELIEKLKKEASSEKGSYLEISPKYSIQYRGGITFRIKFENMSEKYKDYPVNIEGIKTLYKNPKADDMYHKPYAKAILDYLKSQGLKDYKEVNTNKPYILIIDEINRGNISKILGELITLIEESKRIGNEEELRVSLPYSQKEFDGGKGFGVPNNLYIIGTMNTADRSIALLDTALRRRFSFEEMMPKPENLSPNCAGVDLQKLLKTINERIEFLLDREHTIGHAFFIGVEDLKGLKSVFQNKIIPLLQEYFYEDYSKIFAVLNGNGMVKDITKNFKDILKGDLMDTEKKIYEITESENWKVEDFQNIYKDKNPNNNKPPQ